VPEVDLFGSIQLTLATYSMKLYFFISDMVLNFSSQAN